MRLAFPKIVAAWKEADWGEPVLENKIDLDEVELVLPVQKTSQEATQEATQKATQKTAQIILKAIHENASVTRKELAELCGISSDGIKWQLKQMQEKGIIRRVGPDKGGHWEVVEL